MESEFTILNGLCAAVIKASIPVGGISTPTANETTAEQARQIPHGRVATYGQLSKLVPQPAGVSGQEYKTSASRWVGLAMSACPDDVPWDRVVNSQGKFNHLSANEQQRRLEAEGVTFTDGKVNLTEFQWREPGSKDEPTQGSLFG